MEAVEGCKAVRGESVEHHETGVVTAVKTH